MQQIQKMVIIKKYGEAGALSNTIAYHRTEDDGNWTLEEDELITVVVRGVAQEVSENG